MLEHQDRIENAKKKYNNKKTETFVFLISACANNNRDITDQRPKLTKKTTTC